MADTSVQRLSKPQMRGLLNKKTPMLLATCLIFSGIAGVIYRTLVGNRRKAVYAEFHKHEEKQLQRATALKVFVPYSTANPLPLSDNLLHLRLEHGSFSGRNYDAEKAYERMKAKGVFKNV